MNVLLDTSVLIAHERGTWDSPAFLENVVGSNRAVISVISVTEFYEGVLRATTAARQEVRRSFFESLMAAYEVIPIGVEDALTHARTKESLRREGISIGPHDLFIAATCLQHDLALATLNSAEFSRIPTLRLAPVERFVI